MDNSIRIELKIRQLYFGIIPKKQRMSVRSRLMTRLQIGKQAFETRLNGGVKLSLDEAVVWSQELNVELGELFSYLPTPSVQEAKEQVSTG